ncbi:haloacid dehalogenase [Brachybacterium endophyticum]|uniref:Haloacid dehalogenase n=1 Tax=Brachybacterium endophyticum TaxID=2182385 RepID=A0A2U2RNM8_9MICO|nr:HAD hydrolase family protein [Brachybacterium endophyticum]PWH07487.1 haloacid dehalogenase [Brachybacterium endophyticum]
MPTPVSRRIVLTDFDGTLADRGDVPRAHREAIEKARAAGHVVMLSTGRALCMLTREVQGLFDGVISGAGAVVDIDGERLCDHTMPPAIARRCVEVLDGYGVGFALEARDALYTTPKTAEMMRARLSDHGRAPQNAAEVLSALRTPESLIGPTFAKISVWGSPVPMETLVEQIDPSLRPLPNSIAADDTHAGELQLRDVDKADGLRLAAAHLGIDVAETIAIGDGMNDLGMLEAAGTAVAIEGGAPALLEHADLVVPGPGGNGFALALDRLDLY